MKGLLLVNLGTPLSSSKWDVFKYLLEFLTDGRVIDIPWLKRQILVRGIIVPSRFRESANNYKAVWTEKGSPLLFHSQNLAEKVQKELGNVKVELAMRYQVPSIESALNRLKGVQELVVLPLFPQYASATTGSIHQKVMDIVSKWDFVPSLSLINNFHDHPLFIKAFKEVAAPFHLDNYDDVLFSFHGLPLRQLQKNSSHCNSLKCCSIKNDKNGACYGAQCYETARLIAKELGLKSYQVTFQSRLGKEPWKEPFTLDVIKSCAKEGKKKLLVFSPAFVADCLETIHEIGVEYAHEFKSCGGEKLDLVPSLNDSSEFVGLVVTMFNQKLSQ